MVGSSFEIPVRAVYRYLPFWYTSTRVIKMDKTYCIGADKPGIKRVNRRLGTRRIRYCGTVFVIAAV